MIDDGRLIMDKKIIELVEKMELPDVNGGQYVHGWNDACKRILFEIERDFTLVCIEINEKKEDKR